MKWFQQLYLFGGGNKPMDPWLICLLCGIAIVIGVILLCKASVTRFRRELTWGRDGAPVSIYAAVSGSSFLISGGLLGLMSEAWDIKDEVKVVWFWLMVFIFINVLMSALYDHKLHKRKTL